MHWLNLLLCFSSIYSKNHAKALESLQASLEAEAKGKADALRLKKKLETEVNELEIQLDAANRNYAEASKTVKKLQITIKVMKYLKMKIG